MKLLKSMVVSCFTATVLTAGSVHAEAISSDTVMQTQAAQYNKQQLVAMVNRADVQNKLIGLGVDTNDAVDRINAMTDSEIAQLNDENNQAPAGGIVGAVLTVLAVIAILDLAGVTDVYPFIRPVSN